MNLKIKISLFSRKMSLSFSYLEPVNNNMEPMITISRREYDALLNNSNRNILHMESSTPVTVPVSQSNWIKLESMPPEINDEALESYFNELNKKTFRDTRFVYLLEQIKEGSKYPDFDGKYYRFRTGSVCATYYPISKKWVLRSTGRH